MSEAREIKFRVWDTYNERMIEQPYLFDKSYDYDKVDDPRFNTPFIYYETWGDVEDGIRRPCFVMQFTGLKDKNGNEIYEGDVLDGHSDGLVKVEWNDKSAGWDCIFSDGANISLAELCTYFGNNAIIKGNIYQNTEPK